ncbi:hypothetical protein GYMLUDRAFT_385663 [Collybiopsis luxurians FD-317 M1]|nr:hypothetical protein GYMLUDRAFT_385663 [Collybiopsis luxurians FD-317 M1]
MLIRRIVGNGIDELLTSMLGVNGASDGEEEPIVAATSEGEEVLVMRDEETVCDMELVCDEEIVCDVETVCDADAICDVDGVFVG